MVAPDARADVLSNHIAAQASATAAPAYVQRVEIWLAGFDIATERGTLRDDIRPGLRTEGFERRITVAFTVVDATVTILRVFYAGQDWATALGEP